MTLLSCSDNKKKKGSSLFCIFLSLIETKKYRFSISSSFAYDDDEKNCLFLSNSSCLSFCERRKVPPHKKGSEAFSLSLDCLTTTSMKENICSLSLQRNYASFLFDKKEARDAKGGDCVSAFLHLMSFNDNEGEGTK